MNSPAEYPPAAYTVSYITSELMTRLLDVQAEEAQVGKGREAIMRWKTDDQRWKNAWLTPTGALTESSSPPSSESQSPVRSDLVTPATQFPESPPVEIHTASSTPIIKQRHPSRDQSHTNSKPARSLSVIEKPTEKLPFPDIRSPMCEQKVYSSDSPLNGSRVGQVPAKRLSSEARQCSEYEQERLSCNPGVKRRKLEEGDIARRIADEDQPEAKITLDLPTTKNTCSSAPYDPIYMVNTTTRIPSVQVVKSRHRATTSRQRQSRRLQRLPPEL